MTVQTFLDGRVTLHCGDCLDVLTALRDSSVDSVVCDPPYHLVSIVKRFGAKNAAKAKVGKTGAYARASAGFMGKQWDGGDIAFRVELWTQVLRVLKPGGHLLAFSGTRTYHRMGCAIEDAGFDVRDQIGWAYGSGFPKSHNAGHGWGSALKPAWEPIVLARKQLIGTIAENVAEYGTGAINIDGCRVDTADNLSGGAYTGSQRHDGTKNWRYKNGGAGRSPLPGDEREGAALGMFQPGKQQKKSSFSLLAAGLQTSFTTALRRFWRHFLRRQVARSAATEMSPRRTEYMEISKFAMSVAMLVTVAPLPASSTRRKLTRKTASAPSIRPSNPST